MRLLTKKFIASLIFLVFLQSGSVMAQNMFAPVIRVNDDVVTNYELQQRALLLKAIRAPGNAIQLAREQLVDDRLKSQAAAALGVNLSSEALEAGLTEFAAKGNISGKEFLAELSKIGVYPQTVYDFLRPSLLWREVVQARFAAQSAVSQNEISRALVAQQTGGGLRVLLAEIIIPLDPNFPEDALALAEEISKVKTAAQFAQYARQYSATQSAANGGNLAWRNLQDFPEGLRRLILGLKPGDIAGPLTSPQAIAFFRMRDLAETGYKSPPVDQVSYIDLTFSQNIAEALVPTLQRDLDRCDDLYGILPETLRDDITVETASPNRIPVTTAAILATLDPNEYQILSGTNETRLVMLCARSVTPPEQMDEDSFALGLRNRKIEGLAESYLDQLRQDARIISQ